MVAAAWVVFDDCWRAGLQICRGCDRLWRLGGRDGSEETVSTWKQILLVQPLPGLELV